MRTDDSADSAPHSAAISTTIRLQSHSPLAGILRLLGFVDLCALVAVVMPHTWMEWGHEATGLGELPTEPIVGYLARSASALYALHGLLLIYLSLDVARYWGLIRFLAVAAVLHGMVVLTIDWREEMPVWWILVEGPTFTATGLVVLTVQASLGRAQPEHAA